MRTLFDFDLRGYQWYMVEQCWAKPHVLLAVDMGLGKTAAVGTFLEEYLADMPDRKVLIVAPKLVATDTWPTEFKRWFHLRKLDFAVMSGTPLEREVAALSTAPIHIINKENLQWLWAFLRDGKDWDYDVLVIDEASMLKEGKHRTKRAGGGKGSMPLSRFGILARARGKCGVKRVIEMTGTPAPEGIHNLWGLMYVLDQGDRLGSNKQAFEDRWFDKGYMGWNMDPKPGAEEEIMEAVKDLMVSLRAEDHLELPPVITTPLTDIWVDLTPAQMKAYKKFERELFSEEYNVEAVTKGVLVNKLMQFANGFMYRNHEDGGREQVDIHSHKLNALAELIESLQGHPLLLAYAYEEDRAKLRKKFGKKITFLDEAGKNVIKNWNSGKIKILATHPASIGHGTNLQFGGFHACWYGLCHSGETYQQFNMRLPRPGQKSEHVFIHHILTRGTWDEIAIKNQEYKAGKESALRNVVRVRKEDLLG